MTVSEYIVETLKEKGVRCAFGYPGGMVTYLMDTLDQDPEIVGHAMYHEQGAAFAACGYAQAGGPLGVAYATSGPGATNLMTGICHAWYESVPSLFITGQVNTQEAKGSLPLRQKGFQEMDVIAMVQGVTKYAAYTGKAEDVPYELEKAIHLALEGRPGPVLLDIPIDVQRTEIQLPPAPPYIPPAYEATDAPEVIRTIQEALQSASRPMFLLGNGIRTAGVGSQLREILEHYRIPAVTSMTAVDLLPWDRPYAYGYVGSYGLRHANLMISQADLIITLGSRLDIRQTGGEKEAFGPKARLIRVDIDRDEFASPVKEDELQLYGDLRSLLPWWAGQLKSFPYAPPEKWLKQCAYYHQELKDQDALPPNHLVRDLSALIPPHHVITTDVGQNQVWISQSFQVKEGQRILFSGGHGAMGYSLPAAIGAFYQSGKPVFAFMGDGGLQMNIQELQFLAREGIPVKVIILNNHSLGMIRHFQEMYFRSNYAQTVGDKGYLAPDFLRLAEAYGIPALRVREGEGLEQAAALLEQPGPALLDLEVGDTTYVYPKLAYKKPLYDQEPALSREMLEKILTYNG